MLNTLNNLLTSELRDLYSAETQLYDAFHELKASAQSKRLKNLFTEMKDSVAEQINDLQSIFSQTASDPLGRFSESMDSLLKECRSHLLEIGVPAVKDVLILNYSLRMTHYLISGYVIALSLAKEVAGEETCTILGDCLSREQSVEAELRKVAEGSFLQKGLTSRASNTAAM